MMRLTGADLVLPDRIVHGGTIAWADGRIVRVAEGREAGATDADGLIVVPGFIDVHVHGAEGVDVLDGPHAVAAVAASLARRGVTAWCPTTVACSPSDLTMVLDAVRAFRRAPTDGAARAVGAHLESNFINPEYCGAQPRTCLRLPPLLGGASGGAGARARGDSRPRAGASGNGAADDDAARASAGAGGARDARVHEPAAADDGSADAAYAGDDILRVIDAYRDETAIVTLAPELPGALPLIRRLTGGGIRVSLGHSGATYEQAMDAIAAGARHATHLFNRMPPLGHRAPGLAGAILASQDVVAEVLCDGVHVHPAMVQLAVRAKGAGAVMAITDATAGAGLPVGSQARLGGRTITVGPDAARLDDGTLAGSVLTMDAAFRLLVRRVGLGLTDASRLCSTTPARALGLTDTGRLEAGCRADLVLLDRDLRVRSVWLAGAPVS